MSDPTNDLLTQIPEVFFAELDRSLAEYGYAIFPGLLRPSFVGEVRAEMEWLREAGDFQPANVGKGAATQHAPETRGDGTCWLEPAALSPVQAKLARLLEGVREHLNISHFLGLWDWEGHYAIYPEGAFYHRHLDRFASDSRRTVSIVFFFNSGWTAKDGGALRLDLPSGPCDVSPAGGTAVFFLSDRIPHAVLRTSRDRFSFAGWFRTRA